MVQSQWTLLTIRAGSSLLQSTISYEWQSKKKRVAREFRRGQKRYGSGDVSITKMHDEIRKLLILIQIDY